MLNPLVLIRIVNNSLKISKHYKWVQNPTVFASTQHFSCIRMKVIYAERQLCISFAESVKDSARWETHLKSALGQYLHESAQLLKMWKVTSKGFRNQKHFRVYNRSPIIALPIGVEGYALDQAFIGRSIGMSGMSIFLYDDLCHHHSPGAVWRDFPLEKFSNRYRSKVVSSPLQRVIHLHT